MKKTLRISRPFLFFAFIVLTILYTILFTYPKKYTFTIEGLMYQLGEENSEIVKPVTIYVDGEMKRDFIGVRTFAGVIDIEGEAIPIPEDKEKWTSFRLGKDGDHLTYIWSEYATIHGYPYGIIYINHDFSKITIRKYKKEGDRGGWNAENGFMISAPARNRNEALTITNELINWEGYTFK